MPALTRRSGIAGELDPLHRPGGEGVRLRGGFLEPPRTRRPDCLVLDVCLPGMSGIDLHRHLVARNDKVPVVFITAHPSDDRARSEAASDWTVAYLIKPFSEDELLDAVNAALKWKARGETNRAKPRRSSHE